ncbi:MULTISPECIES: alpha/beta fold hydrolase [Thiorhodovibrio]|uniref:alpha/beta fold hydrolase n=1 Tax=Thiorhodovibrio TaxID=61593 RepID=UPI00389A287C
MLASAALPGQITGVRDWLAEIWNQRGAFATKPALLLWGRKDLAFRRDQLRVWQAAFAKSTTRELHGCGHFVAEVAVDARLTECGQTAVDDDRLKLIDVAKRIGCALLAGRGRA